MHTRRRSLKDTLGWGLGLLVVVGGIAAAITFLPSLRTETPQELSDPNLENWQTEYDKGDLSKLSAALFPIVSEDFSLESDANAALFLLALKCERRLNHQVEFGQLVELVGYELAIAPQVANEQRLLRAQSGDFEQPPEAELERLLDAGVEFPEAAPAVVQGALFANDLDAAHKIFKRWQEDAAAAEQSTKSNQLRIYAALLLSRGETAGAADALREAIRLSPRNELAYLALAELYAQPRFLDTTKARAILEYFAVHFPQNREASIRLSQARRQGGDASLARELFEGEPTDPLALFELAEVELDLGNYADSLGHLAQTQLAGIEDFRNLADQAFRLNFQGQHSASLPMMQRVTDIATTLALSGQPTLAHQVFETNFERVARMRRYGDLIGKQAMYPGDSRLAAAIAAVADLSNPPPIAPPRKMIAADTEALSLPGYALYSELCATCHGESGAGIGRAARHLFPAPRNFRSEPLRIVSASNGLGTDDDVIRSIRHGQAGSSMPAFPLLSDSDLEQLIAVLRAFQRTGLREQYQAEANSLAEQEEASAGAPAGSDSGIESLGSESSEKEMEAWVVARSAPLPPLAAPDFSPATPSAIGAGEQLYHQVGCVGCHLLSDSAPLVLADSLGRPVVSRDLRSAPLRGGDSPAELYYRITVGLPGTPHPSLTSLGAAEIENLIHFVGSLRTPELEQTTNADRLRQIFPRQSPP